MKVNERLLTASVVSPFLGALIGVTVNALVWNVTGRAPQADAATTASFLLLPIWALFFGGFVGIPAMIVLGLPAHILLQRMRQHHIAAYGIVGVIGGAAAFLLVNSAFALAYGAWVNNAFDMLPVSLEIGVATSTAFWFLRRPDRDAPNPPTPAP